MKRYLLLLFTIMAFLSSCSDDGDDCQPGCGTAGSTGYSASTNEFRVWVYMECTKENVQLKFQGNYSDQIKPGDYICRDDFE